MPVIAIGVAIAADVGAISAVTAAGLTLTTALEVTAAVGATISAIGVVTGNKTLSMIGAGLGLVGGIGAIASGAGLFGAAGSESLFGSSGSAADAASAGADTIDTLSNQVTDAGMSATAGTSQGASDALSGWQTTTEFSGLPGDAGPAIGSAATTGAAAGVPAPGTLPETAAYAVSTDPASGAGSIAAPAAPVGEAATSAPLPSLLPDGGTSSAMPPSVFTPGAGGTGVAIPGTAPTITIPDNSVALPGQGMINSTAPATTGTASTAASANTPGFFGNLLKFAKDNQMLTYGALQAGGNLISGMTSSLTPAQVSALNAQAATNQATANLTQQQTANLAQPRAVASRGGLQPSGPIVTQSGLINRQVA